MPRNVALDLDALARDLDPALIGAVLRQARIVHHGARALAVGEARLLHRQRAGVKGDVGANAVRIVADAHAQHLQRLDHLDRDRADLGVHPLHVEQARGAQIVLHAAVDHRQGGVHHVQMRIDAQRHGEEDAPSGE